jgi:uncharacterized protein (TIGR02271 family)
MATKTTKHKKKDNTDSQVIGATLGVAGGAAAGAGVGAAVGSAVPGIGTAIGAGVGALVGGLAGGAGGAAVANYVDPAREEEYWEKNHTTRPYYRAGTTFNEYRPAYRYGVESATKYPGKSFDEVEGRLGRSWPKYRGDSSSLGWSKARDAVRDAHDRVLKLHAERLKVDKEQVQSGEVDVRKEVVTERQRIDVPVEREEVVITRRKASGRASPSDIGAKSEEIRIPVKEEKVRVSKEAVVTEEVDVGRRKVRDVKHVDDTVRREELRVQEKGGAKVTRTTRK